MNIDHASSQTFARPVARESRLRSFLFALGLAAFALVALLASAVLLFLSARAQMQFQVSPTDIKYGPAQRIPASNQESKSAVRDDLDDDESDDAPVEPRSFGAGVIPGIPGVGGGPLFPTAPQAPAYTPAPSAPARTRPPAVAPTVKPETAQPTSRPAESAAKPAASARKDAAAPDTGRIRRVGGKTFKRDANGALVDVTYDANAGLEVVTLVAGSDAYIQLLEARQDLRPFFRLDDRLIVVVDHIVYRVVPKD